MRAVSTILAALAIVACGGGSSSSGDDGSTGGTSATGGMAGTGGSDQEALSDGQILKVIQVIHESRGAEAAVAKVRAQSDDVIDYASSLSDAHHEAGVAAAALEKERSLPPADSKTSRTIAATSSVEVENLVSVALADFDRAFMQAQVMDHGKTLSLADSLLGMATDTELKANLSELKATAKDEQDLATAIHSAL